MLGARKERPIIQTHHSSSQKSQVSPEAAGEGLKLSSRPSLSSEASVISTLPHDWHVTTNQILVHFIYNENILDRNLPREIQPSNP